MKPCQCFSMAGGAVGSPPVSYWTAYSPPSIIAIVKKHRGAIPIPEGDAARAVGKWVFYFTRGNYQNTPDGRRAAAVKISQDIFKERGIKYSPESIFAVLQNANAYLLKELKLPEGTRGPESIPVRVVKKLRSGADEILQRTKEAGGAVKSAFTLPPWAKVALPVGGALVLGSIVMNYLPRPKGR